MYKTILYENGVDVIDSYKTLFDRQTINYLYNTYEWKRSKLSLYVEWMIHTIMYRLGVEKERSKDTFLDFDESWIQKLLISYKTTNIHYVYIIIRNSFRDIISPYVHLSKSKKNRVG